MAKSSGLHGLMYLGGNEIGNATAWSLDIDQATIEVPQVFGIETWGESFPGGLRWSGTFGAVYDDTDTNMEDAVTAAAAKEIVLYANRNDLSDYWYGSCYPSLSTSGDTSSPFTHTGRFDGSSTLTHIT